MTEEERETPAPASRPPASRPPAAPAVFRGPPLWPVVGVLALLAAGTLAYLVTSRAPPKDLGDTITTKPSATLLVAVREVGRLETTEVRVEKVIDLTDTQSHFFGLVEGTDAILLVAAGDARLGVDLDKLGEGDVEIDPTTKVATIRLPPIEVLSTELDEQRTYVYSRETSVLAKRNEHLETKARQEAVAAIAKAATEGDVQIRARAQAERELRSLATALGASDVKFVWR